MASVYVTMEGAGEFSARTAEYTDGINLDLSAKDELLGIEVLGADDVEIDGLSAAKMMDVLAAIHLHVSWVEITKHLTCEQRELWANVIDAHFEQKVDPVSPAKVPRWWNA